MYQPNFAEIFNFIDALVLAKTDKYLSNLQKDLMKALWFKPRQSYEKIAKKMGYSDGYIERDAAPKLWHLLSDVLGEKVKKSNFRAVLERRASVLPERSSLATAPTGICFTNIIRPFTPTLEG